MPKGIDIHIHQKPHLKQNYVGKVFLGYTETIQHFQINKLIKPSLNRASAMFWYDASEKDRATEVS